MSDNNNKNNTNQDSKIAKNDEKVVEKNNTAKVEIKDDVVSSENNTDEKESEVITESTKTEVENLPNHFLFRIGDTIRVFYKIVEGDKTRVQPYEGIVIAIKGKQESKTFTVRRIGAGQIGVERIFPFSSPNIEKIEIVKHGKVRRSKLYYLREKVGKAATKIKERKAKVSV